jgi:hypothetical protein
VLRAVLAVHPTITFSIINVCQCVQMVIILMVLTVLAALQHALRALVLQPIVLVALYQLFYTTITAIPYARLEHIKQLWPVLHVMQAAVAALVRFHVPVVTTVISCTIISAIRYALTVIMDQAPTASVVVHHVQHATTRL